MRKTRDWGYSFPGLVFGLIGIYVLFTQNVDKLFVLACIVICFYYTYNAYTMIDVDNNKFSIPILFGFARSTVNLSDIESYSGATNVKIRDGQQGDLVVDKTYTFTIYGKFGQRSTKYSSYNTRQKVINDLNSLI